MTDPITRLNAALEGRYLVERQLGQSGMATLKPLALAVILGCLCGPNLGAQTTADFRGAYDLVRLEALDDSGRWVTTADPYGPEPCGIIMYDGVGSMSVYIVRPDPEDADLAYYGRYEVDAARHLVTHKREFHANPSASVEAVRGFAFDGDLLILTPEPRRTVRLVWRRRN